MPAPIFSICIPAHNATKHIGECLESIHRQSYRDWEAIIIDDASEDGLAAVLESGNYLDGGRVSLHRMDENIVIHQRIIGIETHHMSAA